jgi:hypothetical protein
MALNRLCRAVIGFELRKTHLSFAKGCSFLILRAFDNFSGKGKKPWASVYLVDIGSKTQGLRLEN